MNIDLKGKVILLTGASRGIGLAIAQELIESGGTVALHYNQNQNNLKPLLNKNNSTQFQGNLENSQDIINLFKAVKKKYQKIDILINNAGIAINSPIHSTFDQWINDWEKTIMVNLNASAYLCKLAISHFLEEKTAGKIINIASRAAFRGDTQDYMAYAASKGGIVALTRSIAKEFGKNNITAYTVAPGFIKTDMSKDFFDNYGEDKCLHDLALPKIPHPIDIAKPVVFLCSEFSYQASGCTIDINSATYFH